MRRAISPIALLVLVAAALVTAGSWLLGDAASARPKTRHVTGDQPETDVQGRVPLTDQLSGRSRLGYWRGLRLVGQNTVDGLGGDFQLAWYGDCAYVVTKPAQPGPVSAANPEGIAVIDASDPRDPRLVKVIRDPAVFNMHEGLHVSQQRGVLAAPSLQTTIGIYDVSADCRNPVHTSTFDTGPGSTTIHSGKVAPDGRTLYLTHSTMLPARHCLTVIDIEDLSNPTLILNYGDDYTCHDLDLSEDGTRAYLGYRKCPDDLPIGCYLQPQYTEPYAGLEVVDVTDIQERRANPQVRRLSLLLGGRWHTETPMKVRGRTYLLGAEESFCPAGHGRIVDITDERNPVETARITLEVNNPPNCNASVQDNTAGDNAVLMYTSHYISVDDPREATLAAYSWYTAGLRVFNVQDPAHPVEVAYYNPALPAGAARNYDSTRTYTRFHEKTGHLWFGSLVNGFTIVEFTPYEVKGEGALTERGTWFRKGKDEIRFTLDVKGTVAAPRGKIRLHDKAAGVKIHVRDVTYMGKVHAGCGSVAEAPNAMELRGTGTFNGVPATFRACVADNGAREDDAPDQFALACTAGCSYSTEARTSDDEIDAGRIEVAER